MPAGAIALVLAIVPTSSCGPAATGPPASPISSESAPGPASTAPADEPSSPDLVSVILPGGRMIQAEVADDEKERMLGLMYRESLPPDRGMLLAFPAPGRQGIWMMNCKIALDLIWLDENGRVLGIQDSAPPCPAEPCAVYDPPVAALSVLELAAGSAKREGLREGSRLTIFGVVPPAPR